MLVGLVRSLARDRSGASTAEYALLLGVVGTGFVLASFNLGHAIATSLEESASLFSPRPELAAAAAAAAAASPSQDEAADKSGSTEEPLPGAGSAKGAGLAKAGKAAKGGPPRDPGMNAAHQTGK
jgi:Flp pilus assembly pilin Flp